MFPARIPKGYWEPFYLEYSVKAHIESLKFMADTLESGKEGVKEAWPVGFEKGYQSFKHSRRKIDG